MPLTRREFLRSAGWVAAAGIGAPGLFQAVFARPGFAATLGDRYFVILFLDGGNDGLNTVVPYDDVGGLRTAYQAARRATGSGALRLSPSELRVPSLPCLDPNTGTQLGFHPGLAGLANLYDQGRVAIVQGCGYPDPSLSHEQSSLAWQTGAPAGTATTGWAGRHLAAEYGPTALPAITIASGVAREFSQTGTGVLAVPRFQGFGFPFDPEAPGDDAARRQAFLDLHAAAAASPHGSLAFLGNTGAGTLTSTESYGTVHDTYVADRGAWEAQYTALGTGTARRLREVAKVIYSVSSGVPGVDARFFQLRNGGYDTHSDQGAADPNGQHHQLHREVGDALELFYADLDDQGLSSKVTTLIYSEFSRRIEQNDNGTDHGTQGPAFVVGGSVVGGVYGNHPNIEASALDAAGNTVYSQNPGNGFRSTDFRDVYGTLLVHWLNLTPAEAQAILPPDAGPPGSTWTVPDFDLGFLP